MSTLDNPGAVDPKSVSIWPTVLRYGVIGGLLFVIYGLIGNVTGLSKPSSGIAMVLVNFVITIALYVGVLVFAIRKHRDQDLGGFIGFGRAFAIGFVVSIIASLISSVFQFIYIQYIDPEYVSTMIEEMQALYERMGMSEDQIEAAIKQIRSGFQPAKMFTTGILYFSIGGAIVSLIVAAIMQRKAPQSS